MSYCHYHPLTFATFHCNSCKTNHCDNCSNTQTSEEADCLHCESKMSFLGSAEQEAPFWRRIEASFKYPLKAETLVLIAGIALLNTLLSFVPFTFIWQLMLAGAMMSYCFACLRQTAKGNMSAPDITAAYDSGLQKLFQFYGLFLACGAIVGISFYFLGATVGFIAALISVACLPASVILLGTTSSFLYAINPKNQIDLVSTLGFAYGILLCFILMMTASVGSLSTLFPESFNLLTLSAQAAISNFYMVVSFHIMGYIIFQYQDKLGFSARANFGEDDIQQKNDARFFLNKARVQLKRGDTNEALKTLVSAIKQFDEEKLKEYTFDLIIELEDIEALDEFGSYYLEHLIKREQTFKLSAVFKRIKQVHKSFKPDKAEIRLTLAELLFETGDFANTVYLTNGIHKDFPNSHLLSKAYTLMSNALTLIPGKEAQALQAKKLALHFESQTPKKLEKNTVNTAINNKTELKEAEVVAETANPSPATVQRDDACKDTGLSLVSIDKGSE